MKNHKQEEENQSETKATRTTGLAPEPFDGEPASSESTDFRDNGERGYGWGV